MYSLARPFLFALDAERAHGLGLASLEAAYRSGLNPLIAKPPKPLPTKAFGLTFPNPVGLAAGLDKNGAHIDALLLVVRSDKASARLVEQATRRLKQTGANLIGAVLNGVGTSLANGKYGNGYGYGYGKRDDERRAG